MEGNLSKLAMGGAATATTASVGAPVYYLVNQQMEKQEVKESTTIPTPTIPKKPPELSLHRKKITEEERTKKIGELITNKGDYYGSQDGNFTNGFINSNNFKCEILVKRGDSEAKPFYEWSVADLYGLGDRLSGDRAIAEALCRKGIDPIFYGDQGDIITDLENKGLAK